MDALALLCNLHADGPSTLSRLHSLGYESLASLLERDDRELAATLDWSARAAERFLREGRLLQDRLEGLLEEETAAPSTPQALEASVPTSALASSPAPLAAHTSVARVLEAWRDLDRSEPPAGPLDLLVPMAPRERECVRLLDSKLEGLDHDLAARLTREGISTVQQLIEADLLALSTRSSIGFSKLMRLQFLARRLRPAAGAAAHPTGGPAARARIDSSGPFA